MVFKIFGKKNNFKKGQRERGGARRPRPHFWPAGRSRPSPPSCQPLPRTSAASTHVDGRAATSWHAGSVRSTHGTHAPGWTHPCRPPGTPDRARPLPRCQMRSTTQLSPCLSPARSSSRAAARHCRLRSELFFPLALASSLPSSTTSDSASPFRIQRSRSVRLARPVELTGLSRSSGDLSARAVLPLLSAIAHIFEHISVALASHIVSYP